MSVIIHFQNDLNVLGNQPNPLCSEGGLGMSGAGNSGMSLSRFWMPTMSVEMVEEAEDEESLVTPSHKRTSVKTALRGSVTISFL